MTKNEFWDQTDEGDYRIIEWINGFGYEGRFIGTVHHYHDAFGESIQVKGVAGVHYVDYVYIRSVT